MFKGLSLIPSNKGILLFFIKPFLAGALAFLLLGGKIPITLIIGTVFIFTGIL